MESYDLPGPKIGIWRTLSSCLREERMKLIAES